MKTTDMASLRRSIEETLAGFDGTIVLSFHELSGDFALDIRENEVMALASVGKLFILGTLLEMCQEGRARLSDELTVREADRVGGSGLIQYLTPGRSYTVRDLALLMIIVSDNTATNQLLAYVGGAGAVKAHLAKYGIVRSGVNRRIAMTQEEVEAGCFAEGTTRELTEYLRQLETGKILSETWLQVLNEMLEKQQYKNMFLRDLPQAEYYEDEPDEMIRSGSKTGFDGTVRCDAGWIRLRSGRCFVYAVTAGGGSDGRYSPQNEAEVCMARIGRMIYEAVREG